MKYKADLEPVWCPGCGDFAVLNAIYRALEILGKPFEEIVIVSGIGCSGRLPNYVKDYGFHGVHGRTLPLATGVKLANPSLTVLAVGGDGDGFSIGGGHIPHIARRNPDVTYIVMDNAIYGLTKGQTSPTSNLGHITGTTPYGNLEEPLNPMAMLLAYGTSFLARGYSGKLKQLTDLYVAALQHKGFAVVETLSPCTTFYNTYKMLSEKVADLPADHDPSDLQKAFNLALNREKIYLGIFYKTEKPVIEDRIKAIRPSPPKDILQEFDSLTAQFR